jgi:hypothetical protein
MMLVTERWERGPRSGAPRIQNIARAICVPRAVGKHVMLFTAERQIIPYGYDQQHDGRPAN